VRDAAVFGNALHLVVSSDEIADEVRRVLESRGINVTRLQTIRPSLEDAFVALTSGRAANHSAEATL